MRYLLIPVCCAALLLFGTFALSQDDTSSQSANQQNKSTDSARAAEESSSKDTRIDLTPPRDDQKNHPMSSTKIDTQEPSSDVDELHPWDPHKAAKDVEVGDFYFRRKNYKAAIARYEDALIYKPNDAIAEFRLAESLDKTGDSGEAVEHYQQCLKILPHGPLAEDAHKALARLNADQSKPASAAK